MSITQNTRIASSHLNNALANLSDSMEGGIVDPDYCLSMAVSDCEEAMAAIQRVRAERKERISRYEASGE